MVTIEDRDGVSKLIFPLMNQIIKIKSDFLERNKENILFGYWEYQDENFFAKRIDVGTYKLVRYNVKHGNIGIVVCEKIIYPTSDIMNTVIPLDVEEIPDYVRVFLESDIKKLSVMYPFDDKDIDGSLAALNEHVKEKYKKK